MTFNKQILQNILAFLERVQCTGKEAFAWGEAYMAVQSEMNTPPPAPPAPPATPDTPPA